MAKNSDKTFKRITNDDIYREIQLMKEIAQANYTRNSDEHAIIISRQDRTNGKVKLSHWISTTAMALVVIVLGFLFQHMSQR